MDNAPIEQVFIIESKSHAMGLMKEADNSMSFFDPNCSVVSATPANREQLYALMDFILMKVQPDTRLPIFATEVNTQRSHAFPTQQTTRNAL
ncbi:hypothetical protein [Marinomonas mediterranea]|uniref:Uncharacterized protein n=1 Tax=Marinomonas mediterranea (strain ATCC 700492 / JCM 21426 / NBRC 103028 / MMB-1) TaxID=717774 RepID=F2JZU6_MARM1|nr:hypothetical protein [Marinomonas mediterranea]ADZ92058.1 hypothetical protein Marme_2835 [Marinomonas mediterranea MMB-1]WCN10022.1 hypothetical protein GV055_14420 [Marinomonas mediterranea]WCN18128.1 hypothetical protein GV053_14335 [Marinomonas mediterranea MMB-1]